MINFQVTFVRLMLLGCAIVFSTRLLAAEPTIPSYRLVDAPPTIDGSLDDVVWNKAPRIGGFHQTRPNDHGAPTQNTEAQIALDENFIYVSFRAYDTEVANLVAKGLIQGQDIFSDDRLAITLDTFNDRRNSYFFQVNANGVRRDALLGNDYFIDEWDAVWYAAAKVYDWGWAAEMAIPLKSIAFDPANTTWGINFTRVNPKRGEDMAWSSIDRNTNPSAFGYIEGMGGFTQGRGLQIAPSVSLGYTDQESSGSDTQLEPSVTAFYNVTPNLTAGVTLNTDFSATEADERQVNLSRFSLFFPEKRDFFLRDASIFEFGGLENNARPFFSRRIGLSNNGNPLDLDAGVKLTGRAGDWNIGALAIQQEVADPTADESLFVGRVTRNVFDKSQVGFITTVGDPNSDSSNSLFGADYSYQNNEVFGNQEVRTNVWFQQSETDDFNQNQRAYGAQINYPNYKYSGYFDVRRIEENFNPALGFVNRTGVDQVDGQVRYRHRLEKGYLQWLRTRFQYFRSDRIDGGIQSEQVTLNLIEGFSEGSDFFTFFAFQTKEGVEQDFNLPGDIAVPNGLYTSHRYGIYMETGKHRAWSGEFEMVDGEFFGGKRLFIGTEIEWRPSKHLLASVSYEQNDVELPAGQFVSRLYSARMNVAFNSEWALLSLVQGDNVSDTLSINSRLRYQPRADREFFVVVNQTRDQESDEVIDTAIIFKASFNFQF